MRTSPTIPVARPDIAEADLEAVRQALESGNLVSGARVADFERAFAEYIGTRHAVALNSGTAAIQAALAALGIGPGDEVIVPALTFFSTVTAVIHQGAVPVFADISAGNFALDPEDAIARVTPRTRALLPVHYFGHAADMTDLGAVGRDFGLAVVEDCAQAHGTEHGGRRVGSIGDLGCFSFFATKHMTTGEGGMVTTNDDAYADTLRCFRSHGMRGRHDHVMLGYNFRMPEAAGALGLSQLQRLETFNQRRIERSETLIERIRHIPWLTLPVVPPHVRHTYFWCHVAVDETELGMETADLVEQLAERGIEVRYRYTAPLYRQTMLAHQVPAILRLSAGSHLPDYGSLHLPVAERVAGRVIGLPNRPDLSDCEIDRIVDALEGIGRR